MEVRRPLFYKVVAMGDGVFKSWTGGDNPLAVEYRVDEWSTAPPEFAERGYHLCVYDSLREAVRWVAYGDRVFVCECEDEVPLPPQRFSRGVPVNSWHLRTIVYRVGELAYQWPIGTRMFKRVKLVKEV